MKPVVYILYSVKLDKFYIGFSENFNQRLEIHNDEANEKWSKNGAPWEEFLVIECSSKTQGLKMEKYIKKQKSKKYILSLKENLHYRENLLNRFAHGS